MQGGVIKLLEVHLVWFLTFPFLDFGGLSASCFKINWFSFHLDMWDPDHYKAF